MNTNELRKHGFTILLLIHEYECVPERNCTAFVPDTNEFQNNIVLQCDVAMNTDEFRNKTLLQCSFRKNTHEFPNGSSLLCFFVNEHE